jgi:hypothetical protein
VKELFTEKSIPSKFTSVPLKKGIEKCKNFYMPMPIAMSNLLA